MINQPSLESKSKLCLFRCETKLQLISCPDITTPTCVCDTRRLKKYVQGKGKGKGKGGRKGMGGNGGKGTAADDDLDALMAEFGEGGDGAAKGKSTVRKEGRKEGWLF